MLLLFLFVFFFCLPQDDSLFGPDRGWSTSITRFGLEGRPDHWAQILEVDGLEDDVLIFTSTVTLLPNRSLRVAVAVSEYDYFSYVRVGSGGFAICHKEVFPSFSIARRPPRC